MPGLILGFGDLEPKIIEFCAQHIGVFGLRWVRTESKQGVDSICQKFGNFSFLDSRGFGHRRELKPPLTVR